MMERGWARPYVPRPRGSGKRESLLGGRHRGFILLRAKAGGVVTGVPGLDEVRRLGTFRGLAKVPALGTEIRNPSMTTGTGGIAYFAGPNPAEVLADMDRVHDLEDAGRLYTMSG